MVRELISGFELEGEVASGLGEGARFTSLDWAQAEFERKLGYLPYPGTFNVRLNDAGWRQLRSLLGPTEGIAITPPEGFCAAVCYPVWIRGVPGAVILPDVADYPEDKIEILAPVELRSALNVSDGDRITLTFALEGSLSAREISS